MGSVQHTYIRINLDRLGIDWDADGDRIMDFVFAALTRDHHVESYTFHRLPPTPEIPYLHRRYGTDSASLLSQLLVIPDGTGYRFFVAVADELAVASQTQPWVDALMEGVERLAEPQQDFRWHAIIGVVGQQPRGTQILSAPASVGGMKVHQACACRKCCACRSGGVVVLVEDAAQSLPSADVEAGECRLIGDWLWQWL